MPTLDGHLHWRRHFETLIRLTQTRTIFRPTQLQCHCCVPEARLGKALATYIQWRTSRLGCQLATHWVRRCTVSIPPSRSPSQFTCTVHLSVHLYNSPSQFTFINHLHKSPLQITFTNHLHKSPSYCSSPSQFTFTTHCKPQLTASTRRYHLVITV